MTVLPTLLNLAQQDNSTCILLIADQDNRSFRVVGTSKTIQPHQVDQRSQVKLSKGLELT